jgi:hypothetical protein
LKHRESPIDITTAEKHPQQNRLQEKLVVSGDATPASEISRTISLNLVRKPEIFLAEHNDRYE